MDPTASLPVIVIGSGGHAKVVVAALGRLGRCIRGLTDSNPARRGVQVLGAPVLGGDEVIASHRADEIMLVNGVGASARSNDRMRIHDRFHRQGYRFATIVDPSAAVAADVALGEGSQVLAGAVIQPGCRIGADVIVNTGACLDHDCVIGDHAHIAPGAVLAGGVAVGAQVLVGAGAIVIEGVAIGERSIVGAGALVLKAVTAGATVVGVPAREMVRHA